MGEKMNIYQRMAAITADLQTVSKNLIVETGKGKGYKAVSERDIIDAVKPLESKHGVYSYPAEREIIQSEMLESETQNGTKTTFFSRIKTVYRFVNVDNPEEHIDMVTFAEGMDSQDKGSGKAMTYADKYALMKAYKISTGDDPDQNASEETRYTKPGKAHTPTLASDADRKHIIETCRAMDLDYRAILSRVGWTEGDRLTQEQASRVTVLLKQISDDREIGTK